MKSVLHIINGEFYAGAERVQDLLGIQLPNTGYNVEFVTLKKGDFAQHRVSSNLIHAFEMRSQLDLRAVKSIAALVRERNIDVIHTHTVRSALIGMFTSYLSGIPMVHHVHSPADGDTEDQFRNLRNSLTEKLALHKAKQLLPVSQSLADYVAQRGYKRSLVTPIFNGVSALPQSTTNNNNVVICCVALMRPRKGISKLLEAFANVDQATPSTLRLVGPFETKEYEYEVKNLCQYLNIEGRVEFTGFCDNIAAQLASTDIFCLPSLYGEGMPMVILEAMAAGLPIVSTQVEGIPEQVRHNIDGLLVMPNNSVELTSALNTLVADSQLRQTMGHEARSRQQSYFSDVSMAQAVARVYNDITAG